MAPSSSPASFVHNHLNQEEPMKLIKFKFAHTGDWHWKTSMLDRIRPAADSIVKGIGKAKPDLIGIGGDWWDSPQMLNDRSATNPSFEIFQALGAIAPIMMIKGNNEHDAPGSLEVFKMQRTLHPVCVSVGAQTFALEWTQQGEVRYDPAFIELTGRDNFFEERTYAIIHTFSYPNKAWFLTNEDSGLSIEETNAKVEHAIQKIFLGMSMWSREAHAHGIPVIFMGHLNIPGARMSNGQSLLGQDIMISSATLRAVGADYYALNHIHMAQQVADGMFYSGSMYHKDIGEQERKTWNNVAFDDVLGTTVLLEEIDSHPMLRKILSYDDIIAGPAGQGEADWIDADVYIDINLTKEQSAYVKDEQIKALFPGARSFNKVNRLIQPEERLRASEITKANTLSEKVREYARVKEMQIPDEVYAMADTVEGETAL